MIVYIHINILVNTSVESGHKSLYGWKFLFEV